ncbi:MAG: HAMP domain-containing histidine kinase [Chloroflexi bacterium]|nr:HAMP domain-containing histidine kinase [Chloroflexota bacterium]
MAVVALTLLFVSAIVLNRLDEEFRTQERQNLQDRAAQVGSVVVFTASLSGTGPVVLPGNVLDPDVATALSDEAFLQLLANQLGRADVRIRVGLTTTDTAGAVSVAPASNGVFGATLTASPEPGQARERLVAGTTYGPISSGELFDPWGVETILANPYTTRASTLATITGLLLATALLAMMAAVVVAAIMAARFSTPLRRLTEATRSLGAGDLSLRIPTAETAGGGAEIAELARGFNSMAARLDESVATIRHDRDRSREFLADVSHELRTPIAALMTFNELLRERTGEDPAARAEFLESSRQQLGRLDWLAQNLLELSRLETGLLALDLRPDDLRVCVESAVEQAGAQADRRGIALSLQLPPNPVRIRHDPQRIGQVMANLIGNALKFTPRGGTVSVEVRPGRAGASILVRDTGVGIDTTELPHIFERFYRGSQASEARGSGSGLGLAIVKSIVDMHAGRVTVESRLGSGTTFTVSLPRDPRPAEQATGEQDEVVIS